MNYLKGFQSKQNNSQSLKKISKRVSFVLRRSFFSLEDLLSLKKGWAVKTIRKIAKTENTKLSKTEAAEVLQAIEIIHNKRKLKKQVLFGSFSKLFNVRLKVCSKVLTFVSEFVYFCKYIFTFRVDDQKILLN